MEHRTCVSCGRGIFAEDAGICPLCTGRRVGRYESRHLLEPLLEGADISRQTKEIVRSIFEVAERGTSQDALTYAHLPDRLFASLLLNDGIHTVAVAVQAYRAAVRLCGLVR